MNQSVSSVKSSCYRNKSSWLSVRLAVCSILVASLVACASLPPGTVEPEIVDEKKLDMGLASVSDLYSTRNNAAAMDGFDSIISDADSSANSRRLAHLGKALVYLGGDDNWHSLENAKMSLSAAGSVTPGDDEEFAIETDMLMDSIAAQIGSESEFLELKAKTGNSGVEIARLRNERDALVKERDELLSEQQALNEALEKLKNLTLGN